jgi:tetratricopeptide (TPR) repeat protein
LNSVVHWIQRRFAILLLRLGRVERGSKILEKLVATSPSDWNSRRFYAWALFHLGRHEQALAQYRDLASRFPHDAEVLLGLGESLEVLRQDADAVTAYRAAAEADPGNPLVYHYLAACYVTRGELQDALVAYRRLVQLRPDDADAIANLAATLGQLGHWEDAATNSREAFRLKPHAAPAQNLGGALVELGQYEAAEQAFRDALRFEPENREVQVRLAEVLCKLGRTQMALDLLDDVTKGRTSDGLALSVLTDALLDADQVDEALRVARLALEKRPDLAAAHAALGWACVNADLFDAALVSFSEALKLDPANLDYRASQGVALSLSGRHRDAMDDFDSVLAKAPDYFERNAQLSEYLHASRSALTAE